MLALDFGLCEYDEGFEGASTALACPVEESTSTSAQSSDAPTLVPCNGSVDVGGLNADRRSSLNPAIAVEGPGRRAVFGIEITKLDFSFEHDVVGRLALSTTYPPSLVRSQKQMQYKVK